MIAVKIYVEKGARLPEKATPSSACYDVRAFLPFDKEIILEPGDWFAVPTGLYFEIPEGYFISVRPRSGLANKYGITLLNSPGTIDADYRGEFKVILINLGKDTYIVRHNDRIAQILIEKEIPFEWKEVSSRSQLDPSLRNEGGFGSTGLA
ncbi:MAG: deoxyuridine 5'-triphosphate nucleotidohydrolase [Leptospiraceae bacterium]|nr:MAG: deoxyuridine 5'-triphosphate nucleotidohydrolase [Leptospiraceae bacterium]